MSAKKKEADKDDEVVRLVYLGESPEGHAWIEREHMPTLADGSIVNVRHWKGKIHKRPFIGGVYDLKCEREGGSLSIFVGTGEYVESLVGGDQFGDVVKQYAASSQAYGREKRAGSADPVVDCLKPIREAYRKASPASRSQLLALCITYIMTGKKT